MNIEYCEVCGERGWIWDDLSRAIGGSPHKYCHCQHGELLAEKDAEKHRKEQAKFKTCPTCNGDGKVKREK
ncbi:hypothetical protein LCGC14_2662720 [marine sediment metagenome]|uniref:Uncharacterized protein n=1 Tax=marine sediment metagenome TaxID=412755 RepID=A0A0F9CIE9_9ZZZZ